MSDRDQPLEHLRRLGGRICVLIIVLIVASPLVFAGIVHWKGLAYLLRMPVQVMDVSSLSTAELAMVYALGSLRSIVTWLALLPLLELFRLYGRGIIFAAENVRCLRWIGGLLIGIDAADMLQRFLTGPLLSWLDVTEPFIAVGIVFSMSIIGLFMLVFARVVEIGRALQETDALTI